MSLRQRIAFIRRAYAEARRSGLFGAGQDPAPGAVASLLQKREPPRRNTKELLRSYRTSPFLRAVDSRISAAVAATTWELYYVEGAKGLAVRDMKLQRADWTTRAALFARHKAAGDLRQVEVHPLLDLLAYGNPCLTGRTAMQVTQLWIDLKGEAFWLLERNRAGMPIEFWPLPPHWVVETPSLGDPRFRVSFPGWQGEVPASEIMWLKDPDPENPYGRGTGLAEALADEIETDEYAAKHVKAWFYNRALPDIMVGVEGADEAALKAAKEQWEGRHRGFWNAFRSFWHSGNVKIEQLGHNFSEMRLTELRDRQRDTLIQVHGMPPEIMGIIENSNRSTIDASDYLWSRWSLQPRLELLRTDMQERLVPEFDERLILDYVSPVPADREFALRVATAAPWSLSRNEWREMQDLEPRPEGDRYYVPVMLIPERASAPDGTPPLENLEDEEEASGNRARPPERKAIQEEDMENVLAALRPERLTGQLDPVFAELVEAWANRALRELGLEPSFDMANPLVAQHLADLSARKIKGLVNETTRQALRESLIEGIRAGEAIPKLAKRVSAVFADAKSRRATVIARTEVLGSSNFATHTAFRASGVVEVKAWLATRDDRVRDEHLAMDGQERGINDPFTAPDGATAMHPGAFGMAHHDIQCRCVVVPVIRDPDSPRSYTPEQLEALWKSFDRELIPWERKVAAACKRGFQSQESAAIQALNALAVD
jgi:hypothetical protein